MTSFRQHKSLVSLSRKGKMTMPSNVGEKGSWDLFRLSDLGHGALDTLLVEHVDAMHITANWAQEFLTKPHTELGREGAVCPYTQPSMRMDLFWMAIYPGYPTPEQAYDAMVSLKDVFLSLFPTSGKDAQYKTILIVFPDVPPELAPEIVDNTQAKLKHEFVPQGLMIGQFHKHNDEGGLWNPNFHPLQSPIPLLAIRHMVGSDFPFLRGNSDFVQAYLNLFGDNIPTRVRDMVDEAITRFGLAETIG